MGVATLRAPGAATRERRPLEPVPGVHRGYRRVDGAIDAERGRGATVVALAPASSVIGARPFPDVAALPEIRSLADARRRRARRASTSLLVRFHAWGLRARTGFAQTLAEAQVALATANWSAIVGTAPRVAPHLLVLFLAVAAVAAGGFARPETGLVAPVGNEQGHLSNYARLLLGPRAADVQVRDALVRPAVPVTTLAPGQPRADIVTYTVQTGDTIWGIGAQFNVGSYSVLWSNGLDEDDIIKPGQQLRIPPVVGAIHTIADGDTLDTIAKKYNVDPAVIVDFNGLKPGEALTPQKPLVIPGGSLPLLPRPVAPPPPVRPAAPALSRPAATTQQQTQSKPAPQVRVPAPAPAAPSGRLSWPTRGIITTYFSSWHPGIDIAASLGTPIGAADGGTVTFAGWDNTGYGYRVVLNHGNGYSTTYNHLSVISVRVGQSLGKGGQIGLMGSTGRSTGPHLHFEILRNGAFVNPLAILN